MKIGDFGGFEIHVPTSGGKAGKYHAITSNIQIRCDNRILKQFRFIIADSESRKSAMRKTKEWILNRRKDGTDEKEI